MVIIDNEKIKKVFWGNSKIKSIYIGNEKLWSGASEVSYVCNGNTTVVEVDEGAECANRTETISGATFIGWTTDQSSTTPIESIIATGEPMTLYAIYKYGDMTASAPGLIWTDNNTYAPFSKTFYTGIDTTKYGSAELTVFGWLWSNFNGSSFALYFNDTKIAQCYNGGSDNDNDGKDYFAYPNAKTVYVPLTTTTLTAHVEVVSRPDSTGGCYLSINALKFKGKTCVG